MVRGCQPRPASFAPSIAYRRSWPGPVLDLHDQRPRLAEVLEQQRHDVAVGPLRRPGDVVGLARLAVAQDVVDRRGVVGDVQPLATLQAVAVERQRAIVERVGHEQRDQLLGMVVRPVRVRAAGHHGIDAMGDDVAPDEQLAGRLGRRVRRARRERRVLAGVALVDRAVDLVGRDLQEARPVGGRAARLEQDVDADHASRQERLGVEDRAVDVRLGGEVDDGVGVRHERLDHRRVGDVAAHERESRRHLRVVADRREVRLVAGVGQLVEDGDPRAVTAAEHVPHVARADEPGAAGDEQAPKRRRLGQAQPTGRLTGGGRRPAASSAAASSAARRSDGTVPASVQWPS